MLPWKPEHFYMVKELSGVKLPTGVSVILIGGEKFINYATERQLFKGHREDFRNT